MLRLLYITTNLNSSGGVAKVLSVKLNYLIKEYFYDIHIINTHGDSNNLFYVFDDTISIHSLSLKDSKTKRRLYYFKELNKKVKEINPDIIINCDNGLKGVLFPFFYKGKVPLIFENHGSKNVRENTILGNLKLRLKDLFFLWSVNRYNKIVVFQHLKDSWKSDNIKVIHNPLGFDIPIKSASLNKKVVIAVGRISYEKGYDLLIEIWSLVVKKHPQWQLHIYGEGDYKPLQKQIQKLSITGNILFFKPTLDIIEVYLNASILLNTSRHESFGLALIEAMACGLPVLAFENTSGPRIYIKNKKNGYLIEKDNLIEYANQIISLIDDKNKMKRVGQAARESMKIYQIENIMKLWHELFQSV
ncbi:MULTISPECIES: glycosyltransferase [Hwangdonia]|uniref:Glycosyltransferase n=1 Tax=Hwangdonia seohaensis TaxID=1240727 RepID=A0ABW3RFW5_9FLAO|nr:glycosyltransferase [Hwangdonia seohaensis]